MRQIVPVTPEYLALEGLVGLMNAVEKIKKGMDIEAMLLGIVFTLVNIGLRITQTLRSAQNIINIVGEHYGEKIFKTIIKRDVRLSVAQKSRGARKYAMLAKEVIDRCGMNRKEVKSFKKSKS